MNPFDGEGVTGMHAIERILYADVTRRRPAKRTNGSIVFEMNLAAVALGFPEFRNTP